MPDQPTVVRGRVRLRDYAPDYCGGREKKPTKRRTRAAAKRIGRLQQRLHAASTRALLLLFQGIDASGKDGAIRNVLRYVNPAGVQTAYFKVPTPEELAHDFLWRVHREVPGRGVIGVFNRSHYEAVLAERVMGGLAPKVVRARFRQIVEFERMLAENGVVLVKFFLHLSRHEQAERFRDRLREPDKRWKFRRGDLKDRRHWDEYQRAFEDMLNATSRPHARWHIVPADRKWYRDYVVARAVVGTLESLRLHWPKPTENLAHIRIK